MSIYEKALGPDHPLLSETISDLGALFRKQDRFDEAEPLSRRALAIQEKALGPDHPMVAECLDNLGAGGVRTGPTGCSPRRFAPMRSRRRPSAPITRSWPGPSPTTPVDSARPARSPRPRRQEARSQALRDPVARDVAAPKSSSIGH